MSHTLHDHLARSRSAAGRGTARSRGFVRADSQTPGGRSILPSSKTVIDRMLAAGRLGTPTFRRIWSSAHHPTILERWTRRDPVAIDTNPEVTDFSGSRDDVGWLVERIGGEARGSSPTADLPLRLRASVIPFDPATGLAGDRRS